MEDRIKTKNGEAWVEGEILMMKMSGEVTAEEIEEMAKIGVDMANKFKKIKYNVVDISGVRKVPLNARKMAFQSFTGPAEKIALVCINPVARIIGSFFLKRYDFAKPIRMFSTVEEAKKWFREGKKE